MEDKIYWVGTVIILVALFFYSTYNIDHELNENTLAQCLAVSGAKMYGAFWCGHCNEQKEMFGDAWQYVDYVECSNEDGSQTEECKAAGITGYPTWIFNDGTRQSGRLSFEMLADKASC